MAPCPQSGACSFSMWKIQKWEKTQNTAHTLTRSPKDEIHLASELFPSSLFFLSKTNAQPRLLSSEKRTSGHSSSERCQVPGAMVPCCVCEFQSPLSVWTRGHLPLAGFGKGSRGPPWPEAPGLSLPLPFSSPTDEMFYTKACCFLHGKQVMSGRKPGMFCVAGSIVLGQHEEAVRLALAMLPQCPAGLCLKCCSFLWHKHCPVLRCRPSSPSCLMLAVGGGGDVLVCGVFTYTRRHR